MPAFPDVYQDHLDLAMPQQRLTAEASPADFGAASAGALGEVAKGLTEVSRAAYTVDDHLNEANVAEMDNEYVKFERQRKADFYSKQGRNALEDRQPLETDLNAKIADIDKTWARSDDARLAFKKLVNNRLNDTLTSADSYNQKQLTKYQNDTSSARIDEAGNNVAGSFHDPVAVAKNIGVINQEAQAISEREGMSPEAAADYARQQRASAYTGGFQVAVSTDPYGVKKQLNDPHGYGTDIEPEKKAILLRAADAEIDRRQAKFKSSVLQAVNGEFEARKLGIPIPNPTPLATISAALGPQMADSISFYRQVDEQTANVQTASISDLVKLANSPDPVATGPADAKGVILARAQRTAAQERYKQIVADPMGVANKSGLVDQVDVVGAFTSGDPAKIGAALQTRVAGAQTLSQTKGYPFKVLSADEAAQIGSTLSQMDAAHKTQALGVLAQSTHHMPPAVRNSIMGQIAKSSAPTDGYAGFLVGQNPAVKVGDVTGQQAARIVVTGQSLLTPTDADKEAGVKPVVMPDDGALRQVWASKVGNAYRFQPSQAESDYQVFRAAYAGLSANLGKQDSHPDSNIAGQAAQIATGGTGSVFGRSTILPWGKSAAEVHDAIKLGWPQIAKKWGFSNDPGQYDFLPVGGGAYQVMSGNKKMVDPKDGGGILVVVPH